MMAPGQTGGAGMGTSDRDTPIIPHPGRTRHTSPVVAACRAAGLILAWARRRNRHIVTPAISDALDAAADALAVARQIAETGDGP